jgi:hypothetical protein
MTKKIICFYRMSITLSPFSNLVYDHFYTSVDSFRSYGHAYLANQI